MLVTFKSEGSMAPYRVENRCREVAIYLRQRDWRPAAAAAGVPDGGWDELSPQDSLAFAWDEPSRAHTVLVHASFKVRGGGWPPG